MSVDARAELAGQVERHEDAVCELRRAIAATREQAAEVRRAGVVALDLDRALVALDHVGRALARARREAER